MKIAFIGIGNMGAPMARNLLRRGHSVTAFDVSTSARSSLEPDGAKTASTVREAAIDAEMVFTMLPNGACVEQTYLGEGSLLDGLVQRPVLVDCSTVSRQTAALVATEGKRKGFSVADAPVSGGVMGAHAGTLTFMVEAIPVFSTRSEMCFLTWEKPHFTRAETVPGRWQRYATTCLQRS
ncbi:NAD(P)-dependent oxidoreductase [Paraburkholderia sp. XV]|uniref:NAD(P)-dependent oxidoreductase n=1 Tax=Paraburkholderia sp. XV TaxID=2831520 RepID=UPI001CD45B96|nr:NAD(P)-binding domain-containing protein [Paraburkholderia sp. XV]